MPKNALPASVERELGGYAAAPVVEDQKSSETEGPKSAVPPPTKI